jgi:hypothetical protein
MGQHVFTVSVIIDGTTEKVLQFKLPPKPIYMQYFGFIQQKCFLNSTERFKQENFI